MEKREPIIKLTTILIFVAVLLPLLVLLPRLSAVTMFSWQEFLLSLRWTAFQSFLSASGAVVVGGLGAMSLLSSKRRQLLEGVFLLPSFAPALFIIISLLQLLHPFPFGMVGIVVAHIFINSGLVAVTLARAMEKTLGPIAEAAWVMGSSRWLFWRRVGGQMIYRDILLAFMSVFAFCFSSFAIPLIVGGGTSKTVEVLIYEKVVVSSDYSSALVIGFSQTLILILISRWMLRPAIQTQNHVKNMSLLRWGWGALPLILCTCVLVYGNMEGVFRGYSELEKVNLLSSTLIRPVLGTLAVGLGVGISTLVLLLGIAISWPNRKLESFFNVFVNPSTALLGLGIFLLGPSRVADQTGVLGIVKIIYAITIAYIFSLYRLQWSSALERLRTQFETGVSLGASRWLLFRRVILPQILPDAFLISALASFWACGDFALSSLIVGEELTLAIVVERLLGSYRFDAATVLIWLILFLGYICYSSFWRLSHVYRQKTLP